MTSGLDKHYFCCILSIVSVQQKACSHMLKVLILLSNRCSRTPPPPPLRKPSSRKIPQTLFFVKGSFSMTNLSCGRVFLFTGILQSLVHVLALTARSPSLQQASILPMGPQGTAPTPAGQELATRVSVSSPEPGQKMLFLQWLWQLFSLPQPP